MGAGSALATYRDSGDGEINNNATRVNRRDLSSVFVRISPRAPNSLVPAPSAPLFPARVSCVLSGRTFHAATATDRCRDVRPLQPGRDGALARGDGEAETHPRGCEERPAGGDRQPPDHEQRQPRAHFGRPERLELRSRGRLGRQGVRRGRAPHRGDGGDRAVPRQRSLPAREGWPIHHEGVAARAQAGMPGQRGLGRGVASRPATRDHAQRPEARPGPAREARARSARQRGWKPGGTRAARGGGRPARRRRRRGGAESAD